MFKCAITTCTFILLLNFGVYLTAAVPSTEAPPTTILKPLFIKIRERKSLTIRPGTLYELYTCEAETFNNRSITVVWSREGGPLPAERFVDDGGSNLKVSWPKEEDTGTYVCTASDGLISASQRIKIFVDRKCQNEEFQCESGECVFSTRRCDGYTDCLDWSDERNCPPPPTASSPPKKNN